MEYLHDIRDCSELRWKLLRQCPDVAIHQKGGGLYFANLLSGTKILPNTNYQKKNEIAQIRLQNTYWGVIINNMLGAQILPPGGMTQHGMIQPEECHLVAWHSMAWYNLKSATWWHDTAWHDTTWRMSPGVMTQHGMIQPGECHLVSWHSMAWYNLKSATWWHDIACQHLESHSKPTRIYLSVT